MIHAICDFCGKEAGRSAFLLTLTPFQNFARYHTDSEPYGSSGPRKSYCMCQGCHEKAGLPNPYHDYNKVQAQDMHYEKALQGYTQEDIRDDVRQARGRQEGGSDADNKP